MYALCSFPVIHDISGTDNLSDFLLICVEMPIAYVVYDVINTYRISSVP